MPDDGAETEIVQEGLNSSSIKAEQIMSSLLKTIQMDAAVEEAAKIMNKKNMKNLPVVQKEKLIGIITDNGQDKVCTWLEVCTCFNLCLFTHHLNKHSSPYFVSAYR